MASIGTRISVDREEAIAKLQWHNQLLPKWIGAEATATCKPEDAAAVLGKISNTTPPVQSLSVRSLKPNDRPTLKVQVSVRSSQAASQSALTDGG